MITFDSRFRKWLVIATFAILLGLFAYNAAFAHEGHNEAFGGGETTTTTTTTKAIQITPEGQKAIGLETQSVRPGALDQVLKTTGRVEPAQNRAYDINPAVQGVVTQVYAKQGDTVIRGQTLATIHSPEVAQVLSQLLQDRAKIQADIATTRTQAQRDIAVQQTQLELTRTNYQREQTLLKEGITARKDYIEARSAYETAQVQLTATKRQSAQQIALLQKQLSLTIGAIKSQLRAMGMSGAAVNQALASNTVSSQIPIIAPVSGTVTFRDVTPGETVSTDKKLFSIVGLSPIWVVLDIFQNNLSQIHLGQSVRLSTASDVAVDGKISSIGTIVDPTTRAVPVRVVSDNPGGLLKPGLFVTAEVVLGKQAGGSQIVVPSSALIDDNGRMLVYVQSGNSFQPVQVQVGSRTADQVEILDGLYEGDLVVVRGASQIHAQSLLAARSGGAAATEAHTETAPQNQSGPGFWMGLLLGLGSALVLVAAWLLYRSRLARRRGR